MNSEMFPLEKSPWHPQGSQNQDGISSYRLKYEATERAGGHTLQAQPVSYRTPRIDYTPMIYQEPSSCFVSPQRQLHMNSNNISNGKLQADFPTSSRRIQNPKLAPVILDYLQRYEMSESNIMPQPTQKDEVLNLSFVGADSMALDTAKKDNQEDSFYSPDKVYKSIIVFPPPKPVAQTELNTPCTENRISPLVYGGTSIKIGGFPSSGYRVFSHENQEGAVVEYSKPPLGVSRLQTTVSKGNNFYTCGTLPNSNDKLPSHLQSEMNFQESSGIQKPNEMVQIFRETIIHQHHETLSFKHSEEVHYKRSLTTKHSAEDSLDTSCPKSSHHNNSVRYHLERNICGNTVLNSYRRGSFNVPTSVLLFGIPLNLQQIEMISDTEMDLSPAILNVFISFLQRNATELSPLFRDGNSYRSPRSSNGIVAPGSASPAGNTCFCFSSDFWHGLESASAGLETHPSLIQASESIFLQFDNVLMPIHLVESNTWCLLTIRPKKQYDMFLSQNILTKFTVKIYYPSQHLPAGVLDSVRAAVFRFITKESQGQDVNVEELLNRTTIQTVCKNIRQRESGLWIVHQILKAYGYPKRCPKINRESMSGFMKKMFELCARGY